jgi:hypothetical protein
MQLHRTHPTHRILALLSLAAIVGCTESGGSTDPATFPSVRIIEDSIPVAEGDSGKLRVIARDISGAVVPAPVLEWSSSQIGIARVDSRGTVSGMRAGRTLITVRFGKARDAAGVIVKQRRAVSLAPKQQTLTALGDSVVLTATVAGASASQPAVITWVTRNSSIATVTQTGRVVAKQNGVVHVVALEAGGGRDSARIEVQQRVTSVVVTPPDTTRPLLRSQRFGAHAVDANGSVVNGVTFTWAAEGEATIDANGLAVAKAEGTTVITATGNGVAGTARLFVGPLPSLGFTVDTIVIGVGQRPSDLIGPPPRVVVPQIDPFESMTATLSPGDTTIVTRPPAVPVQWTSAGDGVARFAMRGLRTGTTTIRASAPGYRDGTVVVRVVRTTLIHPPSPIKIVQGYGQRVFFEFADSTGTRQQTGEVVTGRFSLSNPGPVALLWTELVSPPGSSGVGVDLRADNPGITWLRVTAPGYPSDSVLVNVVPRRLRFLTYDFSPVERSYLGIGHSTVYTRLHVQPPAPNVQVTFSQKHPELLQLESTTPRPNDRGTISVHATARAAGEDTLIATAPGALPDTTIVTITTPTYRPATPRTMMVVADRQSLEVGLADSLGVRHGVRGDVAALVESSNPAVLKLDRDVVAFHSDLTARAAVDFAAVGPGTATITIRDPNGITPAVTTAPITVIPRQLRAVDPYGDRSAGFTIGIRQRSTADNQPGFSLDAFNLAPTAISVRSTDPSVADVEAPLHEYEPTKHGVSVGIVGGSRAGTAWIVASGTGLLADSVLVRVGRPAAKVFATFFGLSDDTLSTSGHNVIYVEAVDHEGNLRAVREPVVFSITSSNFAVVSVDSARLTIPAGATRSANSFVRYRSPGTAIIRATDVRTGSDAYEPGVSTIITVYSRDPD